jgi:uncharacterized membrane protein YdjX (TVP38/TMEM64 family)
MRIGRTARLLVILAAAAALLVAGRLLPVRTWVDALAAWLAGLGIAGLVLYAIAYAAGTVLLLPVFLMTIAAGYFFGLVPGVLSVWAGATAGAAAAFLLGRHAARDRVALAAARSPRFAAIDRAVGRKGWRIVFLLRLSPLIPFVLSNYFYGITSVPFGQYVLASGAGMLPLLAFYASLGAAARRAARGEPPPVGTTPWVVFAVGAAITIAAAAYVRSLARKAVAEAPAAPPPHPPTR